MTHYTRRTLLAAAGGFTASLAGCLGIGSGENSSSSETDESGGETAVIRDARVEETDLVIELGEETTVDRLTIIDPTGEAFADRALTPGATRLTLRIGTRYRPGEYRVLALREGEQIAESAMEIAPDIEVVDVRVGANHLDKMPESLGNSREAQALVSVRNTGSGPANIQGLWFEGSVPNPTDEEEIRADNGRSGIYNPESKSDADQILLLPDNEQLLVSSRYPFLLNSESNDCDAGNGIFSVFVFERILSRDIAREFSISYSVDSESDSESCAISIEVN